MGSLSPQKKGKKVGQKFLILFLVLIGLFSAVFLWKVGSILWTLKYGDQTAQKELYNRINPSFTVSPEVAALSDKNTIDIDPKQIIRPNNPTTSKTGEITIIEFIDFECPYCQRAYPTLQQIKNEYKGIVKVVFKHFPVESIHPQAMQAALASECAREQDKFWEYHDLLFAQKKFDMTSLTQFAEVLQLDTNKFGLCLSTEKYRKNIEIDFQDGVEAGVRGTPTYIVENRKIEGVLERKIWDQIIVDTLQNK